ncbi:MAG: cysteine dioxygenase family protein [Proteobacteria bacterium]|nr:cysteine dioxygenase family protein [Pseudomonadota bacterium]
MAASTLAATRRISFPLLDDVVVLADAAMKAGRPQRIVPQLVANLQGLLGNVGALPAELLRPHGRTLARRELYRSPAFDYRIIAITWGVGQSSPIHDHADTWGIEAVLHGELEVVDFRSVREYEALSELVPSGQHRLRAGEVIGLLPPHDLHACRNVGTRGPAVSLHVYGRHLEEVRSYVHLDGRLYRQERVRLKST